MLNLIVAPDFFFAEEVNADRLVRIDYVDIDVVDLPDVLTGEDRARLLTMTGWTEGIIRVRRRVLIL